MRHSIHIMGAGVAASFLLAGCNTFAGVGKDVTAVGNGVTHIAYEVRDEVFGKPGPKPRAYAEVGEACDPNPGELLGASGLPSCPTDNRTGGTIVVERQR